MCERTSMVAHGTAAAVPRVRAGTPASANAAVASANREPSSLAYAWAMSRVALVVLLALALPADAQPLRPEFPGTHAVVAAGRSHTVEAGAELLSNGGTA